MSTAEQLEDDTDHTCDNEQALLFMDAWGTGITIDEEPFQGHRYVIRGYAPEWCTVPDDNDGVVTLLSVAVGKLTEFEGYRLFGSYSFGERECPWKDSDEHKEGCPLCENDNYIYWGEEWRVVVLLRVLGSISESEE